MIASFRRSADLGEIGGSFGGELIPKSRDQCGSPWVGGLSGWSRRHGEGPARTVVRTGPRVDRCRSAVIHHERHQGQGELGHCCLLSLEN